MATVAKVLKCILNLMISVWCDQRFCVKDCLGYLTISCSSVECGGFKRGGPRCKDGSLISLFLKSLQMYFCLESESRCTVNGESTNV